MAASTAEGSASPQNLTTHRTAPPAEAARCGTEHPHGCRSERRCSPRSPRQIAGGGNDVTEPS
eukprot:3125791-Lingulodinium_polyedra.AAC.1